MQSSVGLKRKVGEWVESRPIQNFIIILIVINAITLGMETSPVMVDRFGTILLIVDKLVLFVFVIEIGAKLYAYGGRFFRDAWNVFDFVIVAIALIPTSGPLSVLRVLRILRVLRLISVFPQMRVVVEALLKAIPGIASIAGLMMILFYVFSVMATVLFGTAYPEWFGNIGRSMYTLFQIMTLESWSMGIVRPIMASYPYAWAFFVPFILIATFTMLNLFIAIIVDTMQGIHDKTRDDNRAAIEEVVHKEHQQVDEELRLLREEVKLLRELMQQKLVQ